MDKFLDWLDDHRYEIGGTVVGAVGGGLAGMGIGCHIGIAAGPLGAAAGTVVFGTHGAFTGAMLGNRAGHELDDLRRLGLSRT